MLKRFAADDRTDNDAAATSTPDSTQNEFELQHIDDDDDNETTAIIEAGLNAHNATVAGSLKPNLTTTVLLARQQTTNDLIGGCYFFASWNYLHLIVVFVKPEHRRKQFGTEMIGELKALASSNSLKVCNL
jgi:GNAT superfamily N-acetyltransferase